MAGGKRRGAWIMMAEKSASGAWRARSSWFSGTASGSPLVCVSRWRGVTASRAEARGSSGSEDVAKAGRMVWTGASRSRRPFSTSCITAVATTGLVTEATRKIESGRSSAGVRVSVSAAEDGWVAGRTNTGSEALVHVLAGIGAGAAEGAWGDEPAAPRDRHAQARRRPAGHQLFAAAPQVVEVQIELLRGGGLQLGGGGGRSAGGAQHVAGGAGHALHRARPATIAPPPV
eukprot:COSAG02_NODE_1527_length_12090_cov_4.316070_8_plen_231_part_00